MQVIADFDRMFPRRKIAAKRFFKIFKLQMHEYVIVTRDDL